MNDDEPEFDSLVVLVWVVLIIGTLALLDRLGLLPGQ